MKAGTAGNQENMQAVKEPESVRDAKPDNTFITNGVSTRGKDGSIVHVSNGVLNTGNKEGIHHHDINSDTPKGVIYGEGLVKEGDKVVSLINSGFHLPNLNEEFTEEPYARLDLKVNKRKSREFLLDTTDLGHQNKSDGFNNNPKHDPKYESDTEKFQNGDIHSSETSGSVNVTACQISKTKSDTKKDSKPTKDELIARQIDEINRSLIEKYSPKPPDKENHGTVGDKASKCDKGLGEKPKVEDKGKIIEYDLLEPLYEDIHMDILKDFPEGHKAAYSGDTAALRECLEKSEAGVNSVHSEEGVSLLHVGAWKNHKEVVMVVLQHGGNVNIQDTQGRTPIYIASQCGNLEVVRALFKYGARLDLPANQGIERGKNCLQVAALAGHIDVVHFLSKNIDDINFADQDGHTALHLAILAGKPALVQVLLSQGALINFQDKQGRTPLHIALSTKSDLTDDNKAIAQLLLNDRTCNAKVQDTAGVTALHMAAYWNLKDIAQELIDRNADINCLDSRGRCPLHFCFRNIKAVSFDVARLLIDNGAHGHIIDNNGKLPLHELMKQHARTRERSPIMEDIVQDLASSGIQADFGQSLLHMAVASGSLDIVRFMLSCHVDVDLTDYGGNSPLHIACMSGRADVSGSLLSAGAIVNARNDKQQLPLHFAAILDGVATAKTLVEAGSYIDSKDIFGITPLHKASGWGSVEMVKYLVKNGAFVNEGDINNQLPIHFAAGEGRSESVEYLITKGSLLILKNKDGYSPLHLAAKHGDPDTIKTLTVHGADLEAVDNRLFTPLHFACQAGNVNAVQTLLNRNADIEARDINGYTPEQIATIMNRKGVIELMAEHRKNSEKYGKEFVFIDGRYVKACELDTDTVTDPQMSPLLEDEEDYMLRIGHRPMIFTTQEQGAEDNSSMTPSKTSQHSTEQKSCVVS